MSHRPDLVSGRSFHGRRGRIGNAFSYSVDYLLLDPEVSDPVRPWLFSRNRGNLVSLHDSDHGGPPKQGRGAIWAREVLAAHGIDAAQGRLLLLAQPRVLGHVFNPVSFWFCHDPEGGLRAVIAEVSNTFGDRHSYLCAHPDHRPITRSDILTASKIFHVSPFQRVAGGYRFRFDVGPSRVGVWIDYSDGENGLLATFTGRRKPLSGVGLWRCLLRRPFGSRRVLGLIHWQALKLWWKGARYRPRPVPPESEVSR